MLDKVREFKGELSKIVSNKFYCLNLMDLSIPHRLFINKKLL